MTLPFSLSAPNDGFPPEASDPRHRGRAALGHEERFPPTRLSAGCGFRKETIAGMRRNGRDAPIPDLRALTPKRGGSTQSRRSPGRETPAARDPNSACPATVCTALLKSSAMLACETRPSRLSVQSSPGPTADLDQPIGKGRPTVADMCDGLGSRN